MTLTLPLSADSKLITLRFHQIFWKKSITFCGVSFCWSLKPCGCSKQILLSILLCRKASLIFICLSFHPLLVTMLIFIHMVLISAPDQGPFNSEPWSYKLLFVELCSPTKPTFLVVDPLTSSSHHTSLTLPSLIFHSQSRLQSTRPLCLALSMFGNI